jgi:hypothetical protein
MSEPRRFHPTIPITVRRPTSEHLADGTAEAQAAVGPSGFTTRYVTALRMAKGHIPAELLADEPCELVLSTGHALAGHFYESSDVAPERSVLVFIPSGAGA